MKGAMTVLYKPQSESSNLSKKKYEPPYPINRSKSGVSAQRRKARNSK